jgi:arylsulfatase
MDVLAAEALQFIRDNHDRPFFLYVPFPVPHVSLQVPDESVDEYDGAFADEPYTGDRGYTPQRRPRAAYAAMITRMDREIGRIMALLEELGIDDNTLVLFTSDNGPTFNGGTDSEFFKSAGPLRGLKTQLYEGGIRVPLIARWPARIEAGGVSDHASAFWDFMPTLAEIVGLDLPVEVDGVSMAPTLLAEERQGQHDYLYWEYLGRQAVRMGNWKAYRPAADQTIELYDLGTDIGESTDVAGEHPEIVRQIAEIMETARTESQLFPLLR